MALSASQPLEHLGQRQRIGGARPAVGEAHLGHSQPLALHLGAGAIQQCLDQFQTPADRQTAYFFGQGRIEAGHGVSSDR